MTGDDASRQATDRVRAALGLTGWTATLRTDAKERCPVSCGSTERWLGPLER